MNNQTRMTVVGGFAALVSILPLLELTLTSDWLLHAGVAVLLVTGLGQLTRRLRVPALLTVLAELVVLAWWMGILIAGDLAWLGVLPSTEWPARFGTVFRDGFDAINTLSTPVPVPNGILVYLVGGAGLVALLVDLLTTLDRAVLAGIPLAACYAVTAGVQGGDIAWWWFVPPAVAYLTMLVTESRGRVSAWGRSVSASAQRSGMPETNALARNGRRVGAVALVAAVAIPAVAPVLSDGLVDGRGGGGGDGNGRTIRTDNPILDLQRNLNRPDNVEVLRYTASDDAPHYIRIATLDSFDGEVWQTSDRPVPKSQRVAEGLPKPPGLELKDPPEVTFDFEITENYSSSWLPLAYPAQQIDIDGDWRYDTATLDVVSTADEDILGIEYTAVSLSITTDAETLRDAGRPSSEAGDLTELPDDLPPIVTDLADEITQDATTDFGRAAALQEWFRGPEFTYDITQQPGTSATALADFLEDRRGYCEQFAATMAVMARHLGIPARVAVGFIPGTLEGNGTWLLRAHDAHAWPELYFEGVGWVRFEPTPPGRTGTAPPWTVQPNAGTPADNAPVPESTSTSPPLGNQDLPPEDELAGGLGGNTPDAGSPWPWVALTSMAGAALLAAVPAGLAQVRRWRRWQQAGDDPAATAAASWSDLSEAVRDARLPWDAAATPRTIGREVASSASLDGDWRELLDHLVNTTERARYARGSQPVPGLHEDTAMLCRALLRSQRAGRRIRAFLWPTGVQDACASVGQRIAAGFDQVDAASTRLRTSMAQTARATLKR